MSRRKGTSTIAERVFERLSAGDDTSAVRKEEGSGSGYTLGHQRFLQWADAETKRLRKEIASSTATQKELSTSTQELGIQKESLGRENEKSAKLVKEKSDRLGELMGQATELEEKLKGLREEAGDLVKKGYTDEIMLKLGKSDARADPNGLGLIGKEEVELLILRLAEREKTQYWTTPPISSYMDALGTAYTYNPIRFSDALDMSLRILRIGTIASPSREVK